MRRGNGKSLRCIPVSCRSSQNAAENNVPYPILFRSVIILKIAEFCRTDFIAFDIFLCGESIGECNRILASGGDSRNGNRKRKTFDGKNFQADLLNRYGRVWILPVERRELNPRPCGGLSAVNVPGGCRCQKGIPVIDVSSEMNGNVNPSSILIKNLILCNPRCRALGIIEGGTEVAGTKSRLSSVLLTGIVSDEPGVTTSSGRGFRSPAEPGRFIFCRLSEFWESGMAFQYRPVPSVNRICGKRKFRIIYRTLFLTMCSAVKPAA